MVEGLNLEITRALKESEALDFALAERKILVSDIVDKEKLPKGEIVFARIADNFDKDDFKLCYVFDVSVTRKKESLQNPINPARIYVDANTGKILRRDPLILECFSSQDHLNHHSPRSVIESREAKLATNLSQVAFYTNSTFLPIYPYRYGSNPLDFVTEQVGTLNRLAVPNTNLITRIAAGPLGDTEKGTQLWERSNDVSITNSTVWGTSFRNATTAHWLTQKIIAYWSSFFGRNGIDNSGLYPHIVTLLFRRARHIMALTGHAVRRSFLLRIVQDRAARAELPTTGVVMVSAEQGAQ